MSETAAPAGRSRWLALGVLCAASLMVILDATIVTVALPTIQSDLGFSQSGLAWVMNTYLIAFAGLLLLAGRLGDLVGRKRIFMTGLVVFTAASLLCGVSGSRELLVTFRFLQGIGGALASAVVLSMIVTMFPEPRAQAKALGVYSFVSAGGATIGLLAGGVLTQILSWHWAFLVNVPIGALTMLLALRLFAADPGLGLRAGADLAGAALVTGGLMLLVYTIVKSEEYTWVDARTLGLGAASLALLAGFVLRQAKAARPLLPLRVLRSRAVSGANVVMVLMVAGMFGFQFLTALYLQRVLGFDALRTGLAFLPCPVTIAAVTLGVAARLSVRFGPRPVLLAGLGLIAAALALLTRAPAGGSYAIDIAPVLVLLGIGLGAAIPALMVLAMSGATAGDAGTASGLINTTQQVGAAIGTAVLATLAAGRTDALLAQGSPATVALVGGYQLGYAASAGFVLAALVVAAVVLRGPATAAGPPAAASPPAAEVPSSGRAPSLSHR